LKWLRKGCFSVDAYDILSIKERSLTRQLDGSDRRIAQQSLRIGQFRQLFRNIEINGLHIDCFHNKFNVSCHHSTTPYFFIQFSLSGVGSQRGNLLTFAFPPKALDNAGYLINNIRQTEAVA
jgi:hypothetical protein